MMLPEIRSMRFQDFWQENLRPFLVFSKGERNGVLFLFLLLNLAWIIPVYLPRKPETLAPAELLLIDSAQKTWADMEPKQKRYRVTENRYPKDDGMPSPESPARLLFRPFDPNTADEQTWMAMGVPPRTIRTIQRYIDRGGRFRAPDDLRKIYGLTEQQYRALRSWIRIAPPAGLREGPAERPSERRQSPANKRYIGPASSGAYHEAAAPRTRLDINAADSADWESLPGIGPTLARRIIRYRDALGGFHSVEQVAETFGLPDSVFRRVRDRLSREPGHAVQPIRVNTAEAAELSAHPYISRKLAGLIAAYRSRHGPFATPEDLMAIPLVNDSLLNRLRPYLSLN
jgi:competence ComEA-like helix-hairpin-helix protein